jgi:ABC-type multidrug transport system ATPase subunit
MAGLDPAARAAARKLFDALAAQGVPLVMVTHHETDLPERFLSGQGGHVLALRAGRVAFCGGGEAYAEWKAARRAGRHSRKC